MKADDSKELLLDMIKEVTYQIKDGDFSLIRREEIPERIALPPVVWKMKRNKVIKTCQMKNWKPKLNVDGSIMNKMIH